MCTVPGEPQDVKVTAINSTSLHVTWKPPSEKEKNGIIRGYHVHVQEVREEVRLSASFIRITYEKSNLNLQIIFFFIFFVG